MGEPMLMKEQVVQIKQLAFNCIQATAIVAASSNPSVTQKLALHKAKQEFDEYLEKLTRE